MPPKRLYPNRRIFFLIRSHGAAGARSRTDTVRLHPRQRRRPLPPRRRSLGGDVHISRSCCCFSSRSHCCSALTLGPLPGLPLLLLLLALLSLWNSAATVAARVQISLPAVAAAAAPPPHRAADAPASPAPEPPPPPLTTAAAEPVKRILVSSVFSCLIFLGFCRLVSLISKRLFERLC